MDILRRCASPRSLFWLTLIVLVLPNVALCVTEHMSLPADVTNVVLPGSVLWLLMTLGSRPGKTSLLLFPLMFLAAFQLVLLYLFGHSIIAVDMFLNLVTTNVDEATELLDNLLPAIVIVVVIYLPVIVLAAVSLKDGRRLNDAFRRRQRHYSLAALVVGVACMAVSYAVDRDYSAKLHLYPFNVMYNIKLAVDRSEATADYPKTSAGFKFGAHAVHDPSVREVYVLVVGETARAYSFGLYGYPRNTTPLLSRTDGLVVFTDAVTQSNTTHKSVPMLLSAVSAENYDRIYHEKGIITAFKEAGFHTTFVSNQRLNHSFIDIFGKEADDWTFIKEQSGNAALFDEAMLPIVDKVLARKRTKELIVLHMYGSHFSYRERYDPRRAVFKPDDAEEAKYANRRKLVNAYDNTIRATDSFLSRLIMMLRHSGAVSTLLYTSDHGENIFDDRRKLFLHASPLPSYYELHVPLLVWMSPSYRQAFPTEAAALTANRRKSVATNAAVFHTVLSLAGITTPLRADSLSLASGRYKPSVRYYLNDHNRPVAIGKMMRAPEDFAMFRKKGLKY